MKKTNKSLIFFIFFVVICLNFVLVGFASPRYGVSNGSQYQWNLVENTSEGEVKSRINAMFNTRQNRVIITKYYQSNGSSREFNLVLHEFNQCIVDLDTRSGRNNYFYTGDGSLGFPRNVIISEAGNITQISDQSTGVALYYQSNTEEYVLIEGDIPVTWFIWIILAITIGSTAFSIIFILIRGKNKNMAIIYPKR